MDELGKSIPAAEGMVDAEQSAEVKRHNENCLNCGTKLIDSFCHHCGQKDIPKRQTLGELFSNFLSSFWSYEGKFFRTTKYIITKPGFLATEYNAGRRESYYHPARMYVFISFVFFLLFFSLPENGDTDNNVEMDAEDVEELREDLKEAGLDSAFANVPDSVLMDSASKIDNIKVFSGKKKKNNFSLTPSEYKSVAAYDSLQLLKPEEERDGWLARKISIRAIELNEKYKGDAAGFGKDFGQALMDNFSKILFYLLPFFALLLKLLYVRRDYFYSEHLVFSIYYYNFFYLAGSVLMLINLVPGMGWLATLLGIWIFLYLLFAMKKAYQQSWTKTFFKFAIFSFLFMMLFTFAFAITAMTILMVI